MHGGTNDLCVEEFSAGESSATRRELPLHHRDRQVGFEEVAIQGNAV